MRCAACRHEMINKQGEIDLRIEGKLYLARNVSFEECSFCGEKVLTSEMARVLYGKVRKREFVEQTFQIPVLDGAIA